MKNWDFNSDCEWAFIEGLWWMKTTKKTNATTYGIMNPLFDWTDMSELPKTPINSKWVTSDEVLKSNEEYLCGFEKALNSYRSDIS